MSLREGLQRILGSYEEARGGGQFGSEHPVWHLFEEVAAELEHSEPVRERPHLRVKWSVGQGNWTYLPWIAFLDDRETRTTQEGVYCVYLFRQDMSGLYVTFNQGVTVLVRDYGGRVEGRRELRRRAELLERFCQGLHSNGFAVDADIDLHTNRALGKDYEASTVAYRGYESDEIPTDERLFADLEAILRAYDRYLEDPRPLNGVRGEGKRGQEGFQFKTDLSAVVSQFSRALRDAAITFGDGHEEVVRDFVVSLATKQLVILTGLSGSGKTQIAVQFGRWLGTDRYAVIPVRPDWTGPEALFGYPDALLPTKDGRRAWHVPQALEFMLQAIRNPDAPHLLVLDEMNLAHVERYFADVISGMESREPCVPNLRRDDDGMWREDPTEPRVPFPDNLLIAGTVNVDETTYMFSPKVLDRANTMEFTVASGDLSPELEPPGRCAAGSPELVRGFLEVARNKAWHLEHQASGGDQFFNRLQSLHSRLEEGFSFGHRAVFEATRFAALYGSAGGAGVDEALDVQVLQKVLPRLHGSRRRLEPVLQAVGQFCFDPDSVEDGSPEAFDPEKHEPRDARLPRAFDKVRRMTRLLRANQFVSFTE